MEARGIIGICCICNDDVDSFGFKCSCRWAECVACWFNRTGGHKNPRSPEWHCEKCGRVSIYDQDMNFIKRWEKEEWERWNVLGQEFADKKDTYET